MEKKALDANYIFFACKGTSVIALCFFKRKKNQNYPSSKVKIQHANINKNIILSQLSLQWQIDLLKKDFASKNKLYRLGI